MHDDSPVDIIKIQRIVLNWSPWVQWERVRLNVRSGGVLLPHAPGVYEAKYADADERLTIGKASSLRMRVKQGLVKGKVGHPAGIQIRAHEDTERIVVRWALTGRPAAAEEELHLRHIARFEHLPRYTFFT